MATTMQRTTRQATPAMWQRMLRKALDEGIAVRQLAGSGAWIATSGTDPNGAYLVSLSECECPGHEYGGYCKHRAKLAHHLGRLTLRGPEPEPDPPAPATSSLIPCDCCRGRGVDWVGTGLEMEPIRVACVVCGGTGEVESGDDGEPDGDDTAHSAPYDAGRVARIAAITRYRPCERGWVNLGTDEVVAMLPAA